MRKLLRYVILIPMLPVLWLTLSPLIYLLSEESIQEIVKEMKAISSDLWNGQL